MEKYRKKIIEEMWKKETRIYSPSSLKHAKKKKKRSEMMKNIKANLLPNILKTTYFISFFLVRLLLIPFKILIDSTKLYRNRKLATRRAISALTIVSLITGIMINSAPDIQSATYTFLQTDWSAGITANDASHTTDQTGWDEYLAADSEITAGTEVTLTSSSGSATETTDADFNAGTTSQTIVSGDSIVLSSDPAIDEGTGADGACSWTGGNIDTDSKATYNCTSVSISGTNNVIGSTMLTIKATGSVTISGTLNLNGGNGQGGIGCSGGGAGGVAVAGGSDGGASNNDGQGTGGGTKSTNPSGYPGGGGGGGFGGAGGAGGNGIAGGGGAAGISYNTADAGGSGGGAGTSGATQAGGGGAGGGSLKILSANSISITGGGLIQANGGNGGAGVMGCGARSGSAGGGSGGRIYLESNNITNSGTINANGGNGGSVPDNDNGNPGGGGGGRITLVDSDGTISGTTNVSGGSPGTGGINGASGSDGVVTKSNLTYYSSGNFESQSIDMGKKVDFSTISNTTSMPLETALSIEMAANNNDSTWNFVPIEDISTPVTIATTTDADGQLEPQHIYSAYRNGYYWAVFHKDSYPYIYSSPDGITWTYQDWVYVSSGDWKANFDPDGNRMIIAFADGSTARLNAIIGTLNSDGTLSWGTEKATNGSQWFRGATGFNSSGYPYVRENRSDWNADLYRNDQTDGEGNYSSVGSHPTGNHYYLGEGNIYPVDDSQDLYDIWRDGNGSDKLLGNKWDDSAYDWGSNESINSSGDNQSDQFSIAKTSNGDLHVVFIYQATPNLIRHYKRSSGTWSQVSSDITSLTTHTKLTLSSVGGKLYLFYDKGDNNIYYRMYDGSSWGSEGTFKSDGNTIQSSLTSYADSDNGEIGLMWTEGDTSPYNARFAKMNLTSGNIPSSLDDNQYFKYKVFFDTDDTSSTPTLSDITINYDSYSTSQTLTSSKYDSTDSSNVLASVAWTETLGASGTDLKFQVRTSADGSSWTNWCGPDDAVGGSCDNSTYFTDPAGGETVDDIMTDGASDQWIQYQATLESSGSYTPTLSDITMTYVVNGPPEIQNVTALQGSDGIVTVDYQARDSDTTTGATPNAVNVTLQYCTANCSTPGSETWTDTVTVSPSAGSAVSVQEDSWTDHEITWTPATDYDDQYNGTDFKVRVFADDSEGANNTGSAESSAFTIDTTDPVPGSPAAAVNATTTPASITMSATDDSSLEMKVGLAPDLSDATWETYNSSKTLTLASDPDTVYSQFKDAYGNTSSPISSSVTPETPVNVMIQDTSNVTISPAEYRLFLGWQTVSDPTPGFAQYNILRSTDDVTYASIATETDITTNYYADSTVSYDTDYYYKITTQDDDGNISYLSDSVHGKANGTQDAGEGSASASPLTSITNISDPPSVLTDEKAVITFNTDVSANCTIEFGTQPGIYNEDPAVESSYNRNHSIHLTSLVSETKYYYRITCQDNLTSVTTLSSSEYDFTTLEIQYSEAEATGLTDSTGPDISGVGTKDITGEKATVTWSTDEEANSLVKYGVTEEYGSMEGTDAVNGDSENFVESHEVLVRDLIPNTKYYYAVISYDSSGNISESSQSSFTTKAPSNITSVKVESKALGEAIITWNTEDEISSIVEYGLENDYSDIQEISNKTNDHEIVLTGLLPRETYHFRVKGEDADGNLYSSNDYTFIPKSPPTISNILIESVSEHNVKISFNTDVPTDSLVTYADINNSDNSGSQGKPELTTTHEVELKDLIPGTQYVMVIRVKDEEGNETEDDTGSFTTGLDENYPVIDKVKTDTALTQGDKVQTIISWETDEPAQSSIIFKEGKKGMEKEVKVDDSYNSEHIAVVTKFKLGMVYYFKVKSIDKAGNEAISSEYAVLTPRRRENIIQVIINNFQDIFSWARR